MRDDHDGAPHPADSNVTQLAGGRRGNRRPSKRANHSEELTELLISDRLVRAADGKLIHVTERGGWHWWTGSHWTLDTLGRHRETAKDVARALAEEAGSLLDEQLFRAARRAGTARGVGAMLDLARTDPAIARANDQLDADPWLLTCANGTVDLRTGQLRPHDPADLITRCCPVAYNPAAAAPTWDRFLAEVQPDPDVRAYLARLVGYAAIGLVREHVMSVFWGPGANGKSALADAVTHALGDYAGPGPSSLIVSTGERDPHPTDVASLVGRRLTLVHETARGARFDASKVKLLTGGDPLTARRMRQDFFEFEPSHTLVMLSNYRPSADASDAALWRRVQLVPFAVVIPEERRDLELPTKLRAEAAGVLRWIVEGAQDWQRQGLAPPEVIRRETERYRASEDVIGQYLEECCVRMPQASVASRRLYENYTDWCKSMGVRPVRERDFGAEVERQPGVSRRRTKTARLYEGVGLHAEGDHG